MTDVAGWEDTHFPETEASPSDIFGSSPGPARGRQTIALAAAAAIGIAASGCLGIAYFRHEQAVVAEQATVAYEERANADLQDALAQLRNQVAAVNQALGVAQRQIASLSVQSQRQLAVSEQAASTKTDRITQLAQALEQAQRELQLTEAQRATLMARLSMAEAAGHEQWQKKIQELTADRERAESERDRLRVRVGQLEQKLSLNRQPASAGVQPLAQAMPAQPMAPAAPAQPQAAAAAPAAAPAAADSVTPQRQVALVVPQPQPAPGGAAPQTAPAVAVVRPQATVAIGTGRLGQFERVLGSAGVDVARLFAQFGVSRGEGGPFVPVSRGPRPENTLSSAQLEALSRLVQVLPVSAPLQSYELGSPFGVRSDPINGRHEFHTGIDMLAPYMSPIYATAPGVVTYAGYRDDYGKVVEIDHGHGISTRYAHMHRYIVSVGQRIMAHTQIGYLGSTGRVTGPHVHYEVLVNGEPQDPEKFLGLPRLIPVAAR